jgi:hypothetical protein
MRRWRASITGPSSSSTSAQATAAASPYDGR